MNQEFHETHGTATPHIVDHCRTAYATYTLALAIFRSLPADDGSRVVFTPSDYFDKDNVECNNRYYLG
jgi:hypothetical protein